jgi:cytochrome c
MKKVFIYLTIGVMAASCGNGNEEKGATSGDNTQTAATEAKKDPDVEKGLELVGGSDCFGCHKIKEKATGPAYEAIAAKYPNNQATIDTLANKIIKGGAGNWGETPMLPHPNISEADAKLMAKYVLSLKPQS